MLSFIMVLASIADSPMYAQPRINIAHRGASASSPEHTLSAYRLALQMKADFVEPDLQITKDGILICMHDITLERTTNVEAVFPDRHKMVKGRKAWIITDFTLEEIKQLDAGSWFGARYAGEKVPTFQEMLDLVKGNAGIIPETKSSEAYELAGHSMEKLLMETLKKNNLDQPGADKKTPVIIQSFSPDSLRKLKRELNCQLPLLLLFSKDVEKEVFSPAKLAEYKKEVGGIGPSKVHVEQHPELVKQIHNAGLTVTIYTCTSRKLGNYPNVKAEMKYFLALGVDAIFTDNPDEFPK